MGVLLRLMGSRLWADPGRGARSSTGWAHALGTTQAPLHLLGISGIKRLKPHLGAARVH